MLAADVGVISLPITNLYLQGWQHPVATPRGLTALRALLDAGVRVAAGADNVRDPFNPVGRSDALETASLLVTAGHLTPDEAYGLVSDGARSVMGLPGAGALPGARADFLAVDATSVTDAVANAPAERHVVAGGRLVAVTEVRRRVAAPDRRAGAATGSPPGARAAAPSRENRPRPREHEVAVTTTAPAPVTATDTLLDFRNVEMTFPNGTIALQGVDLTVDRGQFVSVVGPSGCGKSTLLRIASGLETASDGTAGVAADRIGYVFQDATLLPWRSVQGNVELLAELGHMPKAERAAKAAHAIDLVGLGGFESNLPKQLSGGMRMRVSLARSLTLDPELFLFDEPFGALDEITRERLNDELLRLFVEQQFAGLFITHSVSEAVYLSTEVIVMSGPGSIVGRFEVPFPMPATPTSASPPSSPSWSARSRTHSGKDTADGHPAGGLRGTRRPRGRPSLRPAHPPQRHVVAAPSPSSSS